MITIDINPIAFTIGSLSISWYGILNALAILTLILWMARETRKAVGLSSEPVLTGALVAVPSGIIVSKLLHVLDNTVIAKLHPELVLTGQVIDYTQHPGLIFSGYGHTIYGAILGAALGIWIYSRFKKYPFGHVTDLLAPGVILVQAIGRVGCVLNGCCYGIGTSIFCAVVYTNPNTNAPLGVSVHPTQVYEIIYDMIVFGVLLKLRGRLKPDGSLFLLYLALYSAWRFGIGFLREGIPFLFGLQQAQVIGIIVLAITMFLLVYRTGWVKGDGESDGK